MAYIDGKEILFSAQIHQSESGGTDGALLLDTDEKQTVQGEVEFNKDVTINGDLILKGNDSIPNGNLVKWDEENNKLVDAETSLDMFSPNRVVQEGKFLFINKDGSFNEISDWSNKSGIVIPIAGVSDGGDEVTQKAYAIVYDSETDSLRLGKGNIYHSEGIYHEKDIEDFSSFYFGDNSQGVNTEDEAIATRADNFTDGNTPIWQESTHMFVDSGINLDRLLERVSNLENSLGGAEESLAQINNGGVE